MKNKKIIYVVIALIILIVIIATIVVVIKSNKPMLIDHTPSETRSIMRELKNKYPDKE